MKPSLFKLILRSLIFYRRNSVYQVAIVIILAAVITGSLLTGFSVRQSLRSTANEHLGNTDVLISSGLRYFDEALALKISRTTTLKSVPVLETSGYCQNFATGTTSLNTNIFGINTEFFPFHNIDSIKIPKGNVAINQNLASQLNIENGDEIIIHFREVTPIPANSPFASSKDANKIKVLVVSKILTPAESGNFSLGISQISPLNVFINSSDLTDEEATTHLANRLLITNPDNLSEDDLYAVLKQSISYEDIGLTIRQTESTGGFEIISNRIFIDQEIIDQISVAIQTAEPVITYLANSITHNGNSTPYSFASAIPKTIYNGIPIGDRIVVNRWLADDLKLIRGDTVDLTWYAPMQTGDLEEKSKSLIIGKIVEQDSIWGDKSLMPDFPGIAESSSSADWDAGFTVDMDLIRDKDELYWDNFKGTPKVFMQYDEGKSLWGSNFGPATAIRFPASILKSDIDNALTGSFFPEKTGFSIINVKEEAIRAASEGVDFSTLFLSLGFFIIASCLILLGLSVGLYFDSRKEQVKTYFALGFTGNWISKLLLYETMAISAVAAFPGVLAGGLINWFIINALNSVWSGAVQTDTLGAHLSILPLLTGFIVTVIICLLLLKIKTGRFLKALDRSETRKFPDHSKKKNLFYLILFTVVTISLSGLSLIAGEYSTSVSFAGGTALFISLVLIARQYYIGGFSNNEKRQLNKNLLSRLYYAFAPSHAVTPIIIIAAGIFAVFITGVNRLEISDKMKESSGGTGGFLLWAESAVPVKENLTSEAGRREFGLNDDILNELQFVQAKRSPGDDASCLNLNHIKAPPLLGIDPSAFISKGSFSFSSYMKGLDKSNMWDYLSQNPGENTIYGIADQTVLQWGLKISPGDTIILRSETGQALNIIIAGGLKSSVFQGYILIGAHNLDRYYPSVAGSSIFLMTGKNEDPEIYRELLTDRFSNYGLAVTPAYERLASFFEVTNTYLSVFTILGAFGMVLGVAGLGFVLLRNYNQRKREFATMIATGFVVMSLKKLIIKDQVIILAFGIITGTASALLATLPSLISGSEIPWQFLILMTVSVFATGIIAVTIAVRAITDKTLITNLRKE